MSSARAVFASQPALSAAVKAMVVIVRMWCLPQPFGETAVVSLKASAMIA